MRVYIRRLRDKLGDDPEHPRYIQTERRLGYRFIAPREAGPQPSVASRRASSLSSRSIASRKGSVTSHGSASRTESFGPYADLARIAVLRRSARSSSRRRSGSGSK